MASSPAHPGPAPGLAEAAGRGLAAHPDDPPMERLRGTARPVNEPWRYDRLLGIVDSPADSAEFCLGSLQEMRTGDPDEGVRTPARRDRVGDVHVRNVKGKVPRDTETFIDEGDFDMARVLRILAEEGWDGLPIPDHTPELECAAPWHAGMAYAPGCMPAPVNVVDGPAVPNPSPLAEPVPGRPARVPVR